MNIVLRFPHNNRTIPSKGFLDIYIIAREQIARLDLTYGCVVELHVTIYHLLGFLVFLQGIFIFLFHCVLSKEVRKNLKLVFTGKKPVPEESTTTRASLLTVSGGR